MREKNTFKDELQVIYTHTDLLVFRIHPAELKNSVHDAYPEMAKHLWNIHVMKIACE